MRIISSYKTIISLIIVALLFTTVRFTFESGFLTEAKTNPADELTYLGASDSYFEDEEELFLIIEGSNVRRNDLIKEILYYQNKNYDVATVTDSIELDKYDVVIITINNYSFMDETYIDYVESGGGLMILSDGLFNWEDDLFGMRKIGQLKSSVGIRMHDDGVMMSAGDSYNGKYFLVYGSYFELDDDFTIHMEASNSMPLLFSRDYGEGRFVVLNTSLTNRKSSMNITTSALSLTKDFYIYPTYNAYQVHIDDWVSPIPGGDYQYSTGRIATIGEVYRQDWWPWIIEMGRELDIQYSMFIIGNYFNTTLGIAYDRELSSIDDNTYYLLEAINNGYEVGIHGQNHMSLTVNPITEDIYEYNPWVDRQAMESSLNFLEKKFASEFPEYKLSSYVPPSNSMDDIGYNAVVNAMEDLKVIGSLFEDDNNVLVYHQIYHIDANGIAHFPRHSSGHVRTELLDWIALNGVTTTGVFAHFIHPDDIIDPERSGGLGIEEMKEDLESFLTETKERYSFLNDSTLSEGYNQVYSHNKARINIDVNDSIHISIKELYDGVGFYLRTTKEITEYTGATVEVVDSMTYFIIPTAPDVYINYKG